MKPSDYQHCAGDYHLSVRCTAFLKRESEVERPIPAVSRTVRLKGCERSCPIQEFRQHRGKGGFRNAPLLGRVPGGGGLLTHLPAHAARPIGVAPRPLPP